MTYEEYISNRMDMINRNSVYGLMTDTEITKIVRSHIKRLEEKEMKNDIYPLVVVLDRYNGTYSGGKWTAWNLNYVPSKIDADDMECADFFSKNTIVYGRGETPQEAIDDLKMILDCGVSDPDEEDEDEDEDEDEEDEKMEPTSVWKIENIDDIWITQDVDGMSLMLKNKDDLTKIVMTGDAIDNFNDTFVISLQEEMIDYAKNMRKLEKENEELKAKSKDISDDNASLLETNKKLKNELNDWKKEAAECLVLRDKKDDEIKEKNKKINDLYQKLHVLDISNRRLTGRHDALNHMFNKLQKEYQSLKDNGCHVLLHGMDFTPDELVDRILELEKNNHELKKRYDCLNRKFNRVILNRMSPTIENFSDEEHSNNVNHPSHYTGKYECIDVMQDVFGDEATNDFCLCNAFKYIWRARKKNGLEDVKKAVWYLNKYVEEAEKDGEDEVTGT